MVQSSFFFGVKAVRVKEKRTRLNLIVDAGVFAVNNRNKNDEWIVKYASTSRLLQEYLK